MTRTKNADLVCLIRLGRLNLFGLRACHDGIVNTCYERRYQTFNRHHSALLFQVIYGKLRMFKHYSYEPTLRQVEV